MKWLTPVGEHIDAVSSESTEIDVEDEEDTLRLVFVWKMVSSIDTRRELFFVLQSLMENGWLSIVDRS